MKQKTMKLVALAFLVGRLTRLNLRGTSVRGEDFLSRNGPAGPVFDA